MPIGSEDKLLLKKLLNIKFSNIISDNDVIVLCCAYQTIAAEICYWTSYIWFGSVNHVKIASVIQVVVFYIQIESGAFAHFECGDAACFPVGNRRILHTQMKGRCGCSINVNFRGDRFSSVLENQMQIWSTNFGVWPVTSHWLLTGKYSIPWAIRLHRTSPKHDQGSLREDLAVEYSRCYSFLVT